MGSSTTGLRGMSARRAARAKAKHRAEMITTATATARRFAPWVALASTIAAIGRITYVRRARIARAVRRAPAKARGVAYKIRRRPFEPDVSDDVLLGRARAIIGPIEAELGTAIHLSAARGMLSVHGTVPARATATAIERSLAGVEGVHGVESHLVLDDTETVPTRGFKLGRIAGRDRQSEPDKEIALD